MRFQLGGILLVAVLSGCTTVTSERSLSGLDPNLSSKILEDRALAKNPGGARKCHNLEALIPKGGKLEGPNCIDNKTVVNGWSVKCVANGACNTRQRRWELNQAAKSFCADWCAAKKCDFRYSARSACDSDWCLDSKFCQTNCNVPKRDACYFQQAAPNYNCECFDPPQPGPPPVVEG